MKTIYLKSPVILRTREDDPNGMPPQDIFGQPAKNRDGTAAKPFKIVELFLKKGTNHVEDDVADHPYIKAHTLDAPLSTADNFTIAQLETMLAEKRNAALKPNADAKAVQDSQKGSNKPAPKDDKDPLPWPTDDQLSAMKPAELSALITARGGNIDGVKPNDLLSVAIDLRAAQTAGK